MKVTAFIRPNSTTVGKNNVSSQTHVYFRVRDVGVDIKAVSELSINPNHWSAERQGYKPRVSLVPEKKQNAFDKDVQSILHLISEQYYRGADGNWLKTLIQEHHHPNINRLQGKTGEAYSVLYQCQQYLANHPMSESSQKRHADSVKKLERYERFQREVMHKRGFSLRIDTMTSEDLHAYHEFLGKEHEYVNMFPAFYQDMKTSSIPRERAENSLNRVFSRLRTVFNWCIKNGLTTNNPFANYELGRQVFGDPFYLTLEERDKVYNADLSDYAPSLSVYRDIFIFQCMIGCRVGDLKKLTRSNIVDGAIEYIPTKTRRIKPRLVRIPIVEKTQAIIDRYSDLKDSIVPKISYGYYNKIIKQILKIVGIDRTVIDLDPITREPRMRPLYEAASTHTARKTFIANLYKKVKDSELVAAMSGHSEGSRAFARYRQIDDEMKREIVELID